MSHNRSRRHACRQQSLRKETAQKMGQDFNSCLVWSRSELRRRRWDLSRKPPTDPDGLRQASIGESRLLRTTAVHIRSGHVPDFEALLKDMKESRRKESERPTGVRFPSREGSKGATFYISTLRSSFSGFDHNPTTREILGEEGYKKFQQINADTVETAESTLYRFAPDISILPTKSQKFAADFWRPKAMMAATTKPKAATMEPMAAKETHKEAIDLRSSPWRHDRDPPARLQPYPPSVRHSF